MNADECPFAPRHRVSTVTSGGVCDYCGHPIPEPWFMRSRPEPEQLVAQVAARHGVGLGPSTARAIVEALFAYATHALDVHHRMHRAEWQEQRPREYVEQRSRTQLLDAVTRQGMIPVALPSRAIRYLAWDGPEVPPDAVLAGAPYEFVELVLAVPVRAPAIDRAAAVRAGLTDGRSR